MIEGETKATTSVEDKQKKDNTQDNDSRTIYAICGALLEKLRFYRGRRNNLRSAKEEPTPKNHRIFQKETPKTTGLAVCDQPDNVAVSYSLASL